MRIKPLLWLLAFVRSSSFTGKSYRDYGKFDITVTSEKVGNVLRTLDEKFSIDWLKPHEGPTYNIGTDLTLLVEPSDKNDVIKDLKRHRMYI